MSITTQPKGTFACYIRVDDKQSGDLVAEWYASADTIADTATKVATTLGAYADRCIRMGTVLRRTFEIRNFMHETIDDGMCMVLEHLGRHDDLSKPYWNLWHSLLDAGFDTSLEAGIQLMSKLTQMDGYIMPTRFFYPIAHELDDGGDGA